MTGIVSNILYAIDVFGKQLKFLIKLIISVVVFFLFGKISYKTLNFENKSRSEKLSCFKKPSRLTQYFFKLS